MTIPDTFETRRLRAERIRPEHLSDIHRMHQDADQMALLGGIRDAEASASYMEAAVRHWDENGYGVWVLYDRGTTEVAGRVLLRRLDLHGVREIELGYSLFPAFWGRGLAGEAANACIELAVSIGASSVVALTAPANVRSQAVLLKLGMVRESEIEQNGNPLVLFRWTRTPAHAPR